MLPTSNPNSQPLPLSLYIHLPWCVRKCPYCDFNSHTLKQNLPENDYINALISDLEESLPLASDRPLISIFFGGGTPSLFSPEAIAKLLNEIQKRISFTNNVEITLEANPGTVEQTRFIGYRDAGINRLSLGIQSFQDEKLKSLGRIHDTSDAMRAITQAKNAGFDNFNIDLMFGLPEQSIADSLFDLNTALSFYPTHLSWYQLTLEPNTPFYHQPPILPADEVLWEMQTQGQALLRQHQFIQYEVSAYSLLNKNCRHNLNYWEFGDYLGIGAGAHGKITDPLTKTITRFSKIKHPKEYLATTHSYIATKQIIANNELPFEFMLNALRLHQAISLNLFQQRTGLNPSLLETALQQAIRKELITLENNMIALTDLGRRFLNDLTLLFMNPTP